MATYEETIIALTPIWYYRHDELTGDVMVDASGNGLHGTYFDTTGSVGLQSAIETDAASASVTRYGKLITANGSLADVRDNFTWMVWGHLLPAEQSPGINANNMLITRSGQQGLGASSWMGFNAGNVDVRLAINGADYQIGHSIADLVPNTWYFIVATKNASVISLYVNAVLVDQDIATNDPIDAGNWSSDGWYIGTGQSSQAFSTAGHDESALFDYPLNAAQILAVYESALNSLDLFGVSNVIPSAVLYSDLEPDPISFPFRHNWDRPLIERISFLTGISQTRSGAEEGNAVRSKPRREIEWTQIIRDNDERQQLRAKLKAQQNRKWFIPILEHREPLSSAVASGATSIPASTQYKDYQNDGYVHVRQLNASGQIVKSEELQIQSFTGSAITTVTPTVNSYTELLSQVCPARRGLIALSVSAQGHTAEVEELSLSARLLAEDEPAIPNRIISWEPTITYRDHEVHDPLVWQSNDWSELRDYEIERVGDYVDFETGIFDVESDTDGAAEAFSYRVKLKGIERIAEFLGWFYARAGSLVYLWVPSMQRDLTFVSASLADMTVSGHSYTENLAGTQSRRDLAFVYNDNTMAFRRINSATTSGANDVLTLNTSPPTQTNLRSISYLKFCRLDADSLEKALVVDDVLMATWRFRELLHSPD